MRKLRLHHVLEATLVVVIVVGAFFAIRSGLRLAEARAENERLVPRVGRLKIDDPTRVYLMALPTDDPLTFVWRAYFPPNYQATHATYYMSGSMSSGFSTSVAHQETLIRARLRAEPEKEPQLYTALAGGASLGGISIDERMRDVVKGQWNRLEAEVLGNDGLVSFAPDEGFTLLRIKLPPDMLDEAERRGGKELRKKAEEGLVRFTLGKVDDP